jgi:arylsulfatase A-like enzyme/TolA-binding protein
MEWPSVVLITMEATRPDHLGCYDDARAKTPTLDQLAREGAVFEQAVATAPLTLPSHASILTGLYPPRHGVRDNTGVALADGQTTLAEHLKAQGYATAASVGTHLLGRESGLSQGFDSYDQPKRGSRSAALVVDDAIAAIGRMKGGPFFLWVQFDDPGAPYRPPAPYLTDFAGRLYDGEIAWMDAQLKRLLDALRSRTAFDNTIFVAIGDHGESLGEHGEETHGLFVYDTTVKVPLIVRYPPKVAAGTRNKDLVSSIDLAPTLVDLIGLPPMTSAQGRIFTAALSGGDLPERDPAYVESLFGEHTYGWAPLHALRTKKRKFIDAPDAEVYDLKRDPSETINLAESDKDEAAAASKLLKSLMGAIGGASAEVAGPTAGASRRDPKKFVGANNLFLKAEMTIEDGKPEDAAPLLEQALAKDPGNPAAKSLLAALRGQPVQPAGQAANTFAGQWNLGNSLYVQGKYTEAAKAFRAAMAINPNSAETHFALGNALAAKGDLAGAEPELRAAVAGDPNMADGWNKLGIVLDRLNRRAEALDAFTKALNASPDLPDALFNRSKLELLESHLVDARRDLDRLLEKHPEYGAGLYLDAHLCMAEKNQTGAKTALTKFLALPNLDPRMKASAQDMLQKIGG